MYHFSITPLIQQFRDGLFQEQGAGPYFMAHAIFYAVVFCFAYGEANVWGVSASILCVFITIFGVLYLKKKNGGYGNLFLPKVVALGWVLTVRMFLILIPSFIFCAVILEVLGVDEEGVNLYGAVLTVVFSVLFYGLLGRYIRLAHHEPVSENDDAE